MSRSWTCATCLKDAAPGLLTGMSETKVYVRKTFIKNNRTTATSNWPALGEIDIIEGVNDQSPNAATLHTTAGCTQPATRDQTG